MRVATTVFLLVALLGEIVAARKQCRSGLSSKPVSTIIRTAAIQTQAPATAVKGVNCYVHSSPRALNKFEKCNGIDTGSSAGDYERQQTLHGIDEYRSMLANNCILGRGVVKQGNLRKVKYSCDLEIASKFECTRNIAKTWRSDASTFRRASVVSPIASIRSCLWYRITPYISQLLINTADETISGSQSDFMRFFMSEDVSEVGCYTRTCGNYEYLACKTNHNSALPDNGPLYTPAARCQVDSDCTLPGFNFCDKQTGLCDFETATQRKFEALATVCDDNYVWYVPARPEKCYNEIDTGADISNDERDIIIMAINQYRRTLNNNCQFALGVPKQISNYRKVKWNCAYEQEVKFQCRNVSPRNFKSDKYTFRNVQLARSNRRVFFLQDDLWKQNMLIRPSDQTFDAKMPEEQSQRLRMNMAPEVTEIGCFDKRCGEYEYIACKTGHPIIVSKKTPLYTAGTRCNADSDCTLPGYGVCDTFSGMCEASDSA